MNKNIRLLFVAAACLFLLVGFKGKLFCQLNKSIFAPQNKNAVSFTSRDTALQHLYDLADKKAADNIREFSPRYKVLVEGGEYPFVWVETQPMGGVMYAKRNLEVAYNNIVIFLNHQATTGRIPGMIIPMNNNIWALTDLVKADDDYLGLFSETLQGFFVPGPALELYYLLNKDTAYLQLLYRAFKAYDNYLWKYRDSDGDGCLEAWSQTDSGEDFLIRYEYAPFVWPFNYPPVKGKIPEDSNFIKKYWPPADAAHYTHDKNPMPVESIDIMGYSYSCRDALAKISNIQKNGKEKYWRNGADKVKQKMKDYLWLPTKNAYFYRNKFNEIIPSLTHNNLRAMYFGTMTQNMADGFIKDHLLNPAEFWTTMPLPSIAANDPYFRNISFNNWSGQPEGLTYQRAIGALENYGHLAEITLIGKKLLNKISESKIFTQQFDPFTGAQNGKDGYGPTILSVLEYYARMYGVYPKNDTIHFNGLSADQPYSYTQQLDKNCYKLVQENGLITGYLNGALLFKSTAGIKLMTDMRGNILGIAGIDTIAKPIKLEINKKIYKGMIQPNGFYKIKDGKIQLIKQVPFNYPYQQ
ncbi:MAG: hypothetical protein EAZ13_01500 [Sphingobacteriia bacterium]|nr:MAG: hypothetical protein EAZ13_01500 [Sphingobacteriia bacterium]